VSDCFDESLVEGGLFVLLRLGWPAGAWGRLSRVHFFLQLLN
jgi:hypothetical protein